jgi:uncharacterized protein YceH (UPF0502 family)
MPPVQLTAAQARVLGALVEKEVTTPDYYPMSLNALINACNQRSNREPVMDLDEDAVRQALHSLEDKRLAGRARSADGRVAKYEHWLGEAFNFSRAETALVCVLLLRGPQTPGELRGRSERLHRFDELTDVLAGLQKLMERDPALVAVLPRQPGTKEARYAHLFSGPVESMPVFAAQPVLPLQPAYSAQPVYAAREPGVETGLGAGQDAGQDERVARLEAAVGELQREVAELRRKFDDLFGE